MHRFLTGVAALACLSTAACTSKNPASGTDGGITDAAAEACVEYESDADLTTPTVSFGSDIVPIMNFSCGIAGATCHGTPEVTAQQRPFLGLFDGGTDAGEIISGIVGVKSNEDPTMNVVTASDPANSFLMHKVDWDECTLTAQCAATKTQYTNCGQGMPYSSDQLDQPTRDKIRRWIAQGAKNN
jgi:hypothetical protein